MASTRATVAWTVLLLLLGCTRKPAPTLTGVEPSSVTAGTATAVSVQGQGFYQRLEIDYAHPGRPPVARGPAFTLELVAGSSSWALDGVAFINEQALSATVPADVPLGTYDLRLTDPWTRRSYLLPNALKILPCTADGDCDDGLPCTVDRCQGNQCQHPMASGQCLISGSCHASGEADPTNSCQRCDPATTPTAWTPWPDGHACDDGNACTSGEHCTANVCGNPTATVSCPAPDSCHLATTCDRATGACGTPPVLPNGTPCDDGYACTTQDSCQAGLCRGTPQCGNTPPLPCFTVTPTASIAGTTVTFDATCSSDLEDPTSALQVAFDFQGDGGFTAFSTTQTATFAYPDAGLYQANIAVRDTGGLTAYATRFISMASPSNDVVVTTAADESDPSATPQSPGGTGLSLREAIAYVNGAAAPMTIRFIGPMTLKPKAPLPPLTANGAAIVGMPGVVLDFSAALDGGTAACLTLGGNQQHLLGVEIHGCAGPVVQLQGVNDQVAECQLHRGSGNGSGVAVQGSTNTVGPRTRVFDFANSGIQFQTSNNTADGVELFRNGTGIDFTTGNITGTVIQRSEIYANSGPGVTIHGGPTGVILYLNTIDGNGGSGVAPTSANSGVTARDNLLTRNAGPGLCGQVSTYTTRDPNGYFANDGGTVCQGATGSGSVQGDPLYMAPSLGDFRLQPNSPMINTGVDLGIDVNGPAPGNYNGTAPDLGANESPW